MRTIKMREFILAAFLVLISGSAGAAPEGTMFVPLINWNSGKVSDSDHKNVGQVLPAGTVFLGAKSLTGEQLKSKIVSLQNNTNNMQCPSDLSGLADGWAVFFSQVSTKYAASLNFFAQGSLSGNDKVVIYNFIYYKDIFPSGGGFTPLYRCGAGVLLALKVTSAEANAKATLPFLAASAELGQAEVEFKMRTIGLSGTPINNIVPNAEKIGTFNIQGYSESLGTIDKLRVLMAKNTSGVTVSPRPIAITVGTEEPEKVEIGLARTHALKSIVNKIKCPEAKDKLPNATEALKHEVEIVYNTVSGACSYWSSPDDVSTQKASVLMSKYNLN